MVMLTSRRSHFNWNRCAVVHRITNTYCLSLVFVSRNIAAMWCWCPCCPWPVASKRFECIVWVSRMRGRPWALRQLCMWERERGVMFACVRFARGVCIAWPLFGISVYSTLSLGPHSWFGWFLALTVFLSRSVALSLSRSFGFSVWIVPRHYNDNEDELLVFLLFLVLLFGGNCDGGEPLFWYFASSHFGRVYAARESILCAAGWKLLLWNGDDGRLHDRDSAVQGRRSENERTTADEWSSRALMPM